MSEEKVHDDAEGGTFTIEIGTWVNGAPTTVRTIRGFTTKDMGLRALRSIGHSWDYNIDYAGYLLDPNGKRVGQLDIYQHTYGVIDLER